MVVWTVRAAAMAIRDVSLPPGPNQPDGRGTAMDAWETVDVISERKERGEGYYEFFRAKSLRGCLKSIGAC